MSGVFDSTLRAWAYLSRVAEPPCAELAALVSCARHTEARRRIDRAAEDLELPHRAALGIRPAASMSVQRTT